MVDPRTYAIDAHGAQRYGKSPYVTHLDAVYGIVQSKDITPDARAVAYLHDVLEDTKVTSADLLDKFGAVVMWAVLDITDPPGASRKERKRKLHKQLRDCDVTETAGRLALLVKTADRLANVRDSAQRMPPLLDMYRKEHAAFREAAYREGLCDSWWEELDRLLA